MLYLLEFKMLLSIDKCNFKKNVAILVTLVKNRNKQFPILLPGDSWTKKCPEL